MRSFGFAFVVLSLVLPQSLLIAEDRPNFIIIFTDDHGWADLGCQEVYGDVRTPNIDALAAQGVRCTAGYVTAPQCVPSRAGLLTGKYQNRFGVESNNSARMPGGLDGFNTELTIAERLKEAGYETGMAGKWHLGPVSEISRHGFDYVYARNSQRPAWTNFDVRTGHRLEPGLRPDPLYHVDACTMAACSFIRRNRDRPFFFYVAYRAPHVPLDPPPRYLQLFPRAGAERRRRALAMLYAVDRGVGQIVETLRDCGLEERTAIFFLSDNGAPLKMHRRDEPGTGPGWNGSLNDPFKGEKGMLTEGGIRIPYVVMWKGKLPRGAVTDLPVISLDIASTIAKWSGAESEPLDGEDLVQLLGGADTARDRSLFWRWMAQAAVRRGKWKYLVAGKREFLFDLDADPGENRNLLAERPAVARELRSELASWADQLNPPGLPTGDLPPGLQRFYDFYFQQ